MRPFNDANYKKKAGFTKSLIDFLELSNMTLSQYCFLSSSKKSRRSTTEMSQTVKNVKNVIQGKVNSRLFC